MNRSNLLKIIIPILLALAITLGLIQHAYDPYALLGNNKTSLKRQSLGDKSLNDYYRETQQLSSQTAPATTTVSFLAVGDIMLSRNVAEAIKKSGGANLPFRGIANILKSTDFNFANLESVFVEKNPIIGGHSLLFAAPKENVQGLADNNFKILNLANNHALDQNLGGLEYTLKYLDENNIKHIGAGKNLTNAWQPVVLEDKGMKICFLGASYASVNDGGVGRNDYVARIDDLENLKSQIQNLKSKCDFIVATMHAGVEYTRKPNQAQIAFARAAIDDGADMVIGSHPHWVQTIEKYCPGTPSSPGEEKIPTGREMRSNCGNPKYIFYSLGNFIFDQMWSQDTREGLALKIQISKSKFQNPQAPGAATSEDLQGARQPAKLDSIELIPVIIENYSTPRPANADERKRILEKIGVTNNLIQP